MCCCGAGYVFFLVSNDKQQKKTLKMHTERKKMQIRTTNKIFCVQYTPKWGEKILTNLNGANNNENKKRGRKSVKLW